MRIDSATRHRMAALGDVNWSEVIRKALRDRLEIEEDLRGPIDKRRARLAAKRMDRARSRLVVGHYDSTQEIREWRDRKK